MFGIKKKNNLTVKINYCELKMIREGLLFLRNRLVSEGKDADFINEVLIKLLS